MLGVFMINLIIASAQLLPSFMTSDSFNTIITIMGATVTTMVVSEVASKACKRYKFTNKRYEIYHDNLWID